ncbi:MAG: hypothetical protein Q7V63_01865 [Gammaproteobacteria bacterium]|nr:hypothetical protein [Gammaproteobacteria bacterium]
MYKPIEILAQLEKAWGLHGLTLDKILSAYCFDKEGMPNFVEQLAKPKDYADGFFYMDTAGIASHILGLHIIRMWSEKSLLTQYEQVLWLPYAKLEQLPVTPGLDGLASLLWAGNTYDPVKTTIVIITGIDYLNKKKSSDPGFIRLANEWMSIVKTVPWLAIGNYIPDEFKDILAENITLPPLFLNMHYQVSHSTNEEKISYPGKLLVDHIDEHTQKAFHFDKDKPDGVFSTRKATLQNYMVGKINAAPDLKEDLKHTQPLLAAQDVIKILAGRLPITASARAIPTLDSSAKWYYAALSAMACHETDGSKKFFLYEIAGHIVVRRMTESSMHYVTDLGSSKNYTIRSVVRSHSISAEIQWLLEDVMAMTDFDRLESSNIGKALIDTRRKWQNQETTKRNEALSKEGAVIPREPVKWAGNVEKHFKEIEGLFRKDINDNELTIGVQALPFEMRDASYQSMQKKINETYSSAKSFSLQEKSSSDHIRKVLNGSAHLEESNPFLLMVAANIIAESARYPSVFFSLFAMLELIGQTETISYNPSLPSWQRLVALPERLAIDIKTSEWFNLIYADGLDALGGMHPMAHNGSFYHVQPNLSPGGTAPSYGVTWPQLKAQLLYGRWLIASTNCYDSGIKLEHSNISFTPSPGHHILNSSDQLFIMRDLELLARLESAYNIQAEDQSILSKMSQPYKETRHLIADPKQIVLMPADSFDQYGYFLRIPKSEASADDIHYVHLDNNHAFMIATKLDAIGDNRQALKLYNYLCRRHPLNTEYRHSRALLLAFHPNIVSEHLLKRSFQYDISYLKALGAKTASEYTRLIEYIDLVFNLRYWCEETFDGLPNNLILSMVNDKISRAIKVIESFEQANEEYSILCLLLAMTYRKTARLLNNEASIKGSDKEKIYFKAVECYHSAFNYLSRHVLTLFHSTPFSDAHHMLFDELIREGGMFDLMPVLNEMNMTDRNRRFIKRSDANPSLIIMLEVILSNIRVFEVHMMPQRAKVKSLTKSVEAIKLPKTMVKAKSTVREHLAKYEETKFRSSIIQFERKQCLLIEINWLLPSDIITAWLQLRGIDVFIVLDEKWRHCLLIKPNPSFTKRSTLQPTPHPESFLKTEYASISGEGQAYFMKLCILFNECIELIKVWDPKKDRTLISYQHIANLTILPSLRLIQRDPIIQDAILELPNGLPVHLILDWLNKNNFAYHWVNEKKLGRCICITEINLCSSHELFNAATSNGEVILISHACTSTSSASAGYGSASPCSSLASVALPFGALLLGKSDNPINPLVPLNLSDEDNLRIAKLASLESAGAACPRLIPGWGLYEVDDLGNCFYDAVAHQMALLHHPFLNAIPEGTLPRDVLRLRIQGEGFKDEEWADDEVIESIIRNFDVIVAIVSTATPEGGFLCRYLDKDGSIFNQVDDTVELPNKLIIRIAATGNHFLSVINQPALTAGALRHAFNNALEPFIFKKMSDELEDTREEDREWSRE